MVKSERLQLWPFSVMSLAHMINDFYANFLPQLLPLLVITAGFSISQATALVAAFTVTSSLAQPFFGYLVDQKNQRWMVYVGTLWMAALLSLTGLVENYWLLLGLAVLAGIGTAAFHPQAAGLVAKVSGTQKGLMMSTFIAFGNVGLAMGPLILIPYFREFGAQASVYMVIPGLVATVFMLKYAPHDDRAVVVTTMPVGGVYTLLTLIKGEMGILMLIVAMRSLVHAGLTTLLPLYFTKEMMMPDYAGYIVSFVLLAGAVGGMTGGYLSDRYGRKGLIIGSLAIATPLLYGFFLFEGIIGYMLLALGTTTLLASFSVTVVAAQEAFPDNKALAAGLSLGFAIGTGGLAVGLLGWYADYYGLRSTLTLMFAVPLLAAALGLTLKSEGNIFSKKMV